MNNKKIIFFLPYAGGTSLTYLSWQKYLENYDIYALDYKGHGLRKKEKLCTSIIEMAEDIAAKIKDIILEKKVEFILFGHSLGGLITWHVTEILEEKYKIIPEKICISACSSPVEFHKSIHFKILGETEEEKDKFLIKEFLQNSNINEKIIKSNYFQKSLLPIIKHNYYLINNYYFKNNIKEVNIPIYVFYAEEDKLVNKENILKWQSLTLNRFKAFEFQGNHYYLENENNKKILCELLKKLFE